MNRKPYIKNQLLLLAMWVLPAGHSLVAQNPYRLSLEEVVALAQSEAPDALLAETRWKRSYWTYQSFVADFKPQIVLAANTLPLYNRSIESIINDDGSQVYRERSFMENSLNLEIQQDFFPTGGTLSMGSRLGRLDIFATNGIDASTSYLSNPFHIGLYQPLFQYNAMRWRKKIEPLQYQESEKIFSEQMEAVANTAAIYFFDLLISQLDDEAARQDKANADTLLVLSRGRFEVGKIAETDLLQVELSAMQAETRLAEAQLNMQSNTEKLRDFLNLKGQIDFELIPPYELPEATLSPEEALAYARQNRSAMVSFDRRLMSAQQEVARSKGETGISASLVGQFGLTQTGSAIDQVYRNPIDQEVVTFSITAPIADWGKAKARRAVAASNLELEQRQVDQERENFDRVVMLRAQQFDLVRQNTRVAERYFESAKKRYDITYQRYLIGKISVTDLNLALSERENARKAYLQAVRDFWMKVFELRGLTLHDFVHHQTLMRANPSVR